MADSMLSTHERADNANDEAPPSYEEAITSGWTGPGSVGPGSGGPASASYAPPPQPPQQQYHHHYYQHQQQQYQHQQQYQQQQQHPLVPQDTRGAVRPSVTPGPRPIPGYSAPAADVAVVVRRQFPAAFNLYNNGWGGRLTLGEHAAAPIYAVRLHGERSPEPSGVLYTGPRLDDHRLASATLGPGPTDFSIPLPPRPGCGGGREGGSSTEYVRGLPPEWPSVYRMAIEVGVTERGGQQSAAAAPLRREHFEWRPAAAGSVAGTGGISLDWQLVRLEPGPPPGAATPPDGRFLTRDGREVVATWADKRISLSKCANFAFVGSALTGVFGERWDVMAVITALAIWEKSRRARIHAGSDPFSPPRNSMG